MLIHKGEKLMNFKVFIPAMLLASLKTLSLFSLTLLCSLPLGLILCFARMSKKRALSLPAQIYILLMRGTPLMLQLMFIFYGLNPIFGIQPPRFTSAVIAFSLNYAAYFAEIYRGGIISISTGQYDAGKVLGFSKRKTFTIIILPQVIKRVLPTMSNEFMTLIKDTSLAQTIVIVEIMRTTERYANAYVSAIPFGVAAIFYLVMNAIIGKAFSFAEKKLNYYKL